MVYNKPKGCSVHPEPWLWTLTTTTTTNNNNNNNNANKTIKYSFMHSTLLNFVIVIIPWHYKRSSY
jgi:hypothetical protein